MMCWEGFGGRVSALYMQAHRAEARHACGDRKATRRTYAESEDAEEHDGEARVGGRDRERVIDRSSLEKSKSEIHCHESELGALTMECL